MISKSFSIFNIELNVGQRQDNQCSNCAFCNVTLVFRFEAKRTTVSHILGNLGCIFCINQSLSEANRRLLHIKSTGDLSHLQCFYSAVAPARQESLSGETKFDKTINMIQRVQFVISKSFYVLGLLLNHMSVLKDALCMY